VTAGQISIQGILLTMFEWITIDDTPGQRQYASIECNAIIREFTDGLSLSINGTPRGKFKTVDIAKKYVEESYSRCVASEFYKLADVNALH
jgi:hypothetical protein